MLCWVPKRVTWKVERVGCCFERVVMRGGMPLPRERAWPRKGVMYGSGGGE